MSIKVRTGGIHLIGRDALRTLIFLSMASACSPTDTVGEGESALNKVESAQRIETPSWVTSDYRRMEDAEIESLLSQYALVALIDDSQLMIRKENSNYIVSSVGNRANGGISPGVEYVLKNGAFRPAKYNFGFFILFARESGGVDNEGPWIFSYGPMNEDSKELTSYAAIPLAEEEGH